MLFGSLLDCIILQLHVQANLVRITHDPPWHIFIVSLPFVFTFLFKNNFLMVYMVYIK